MCDSNCLHEQQEITEAYVEEYLISKKRDIICGKSILQVRKRPLNVQMVVQQTARVFLPFKVRFLFVAVAHNHNVGCSALLFSNIDTLVSSILGNDHQNNRLSVYPYKFATLKRSIGISFRRFQIKESTILFLDTLLCCGLFFHPFLCLIFFTLQPVNIRYIVCTQNNNDHYSNVTAVGLYSIENMKVRVTCFITVCFT